ncbi:hypothetical protein [Dubosiella newyorkensis]|uniref:hypothetical protein n=1 Tax=Dubosiella newyorkensis TaxID=1862672 RepID=UPI00272C86BE|nr:hypothetical protein [Dubosiella newyorkensis]
MSKLYGYVLSQNGYHDKPVKLDSENIPALAKFICDDPIRDKIITDEADKTVITTCGCFLDRVDKSTIDFPALLNEVQNIQLGESLEDEEFEDDYEMD